MKKARLIFKNNTPFSLDFEDFYFNSSDGVKESKFVYTEAFEWGESEEFVIGELGFGVGLNFFLTLQRFLRDKNTPKRLFYVSLEGFYIEKEEFRLCYEKLGMYEEFKELLEHFLRFYPKNKEGIYRFYFKNCFLDLVFGGVSFLEKLEFKADVWYLDGFSPGKNKEMFEESLISQLARLSKQNAKILTFSASSFLRKNLENQGFLVQKTKGFKKREMIRAFFNANEQFCVKEPYFAKVSQKTANKKVAIIGAGISAASLAYELSLRDFEVSIFEKNSALGQGASGNESGILSSLILKPGVLLGEFSQNAFVEASRFYKQILNLNLNGVLEFAHTLAMKERFLSQSKNILFKIEQNKAFLEDAGVISPKEIVETLFKLSKAKLHFKHEFTHFTYENENFTLHFKTENEEQNLKENAKDGFQKGGFGILIYAMGADTRDFLCYKAMNLSKVRGQVSHLKPFLDTKFALSSRAYICPANDSLQVIGASYDRLNSNILPQSFDNEENLKNIKEFLKGDEKLEILGARVGFRSYSSDRFIIAGAAYDEEFYEQNYKSLHWGANKARVLPKNIPNLYLNFAHGSRAFSTSVLAARYLCALICEEPLGIFKDFIPCIHPARFLIRKLKKGL